MAVDLSVNIGANVNEAVKGLGLVAERAKHLQDGIAVLRAKLADTKSEKFYAFALDNIAKKQAELNKIQKSTGEALNKTSVNSAKATQSLTDLSRIAQDAPYGFNAIANNLNPLVESFGRLRVSTGSTSGALKALLSGLAGPAGIGVAVGIASSLLVKFGGDLLGAGKAAEKAKSDSDKLKDSINGIFGEVAKEASQVASFVAVLKSETETRQRKLSAIKELQQIQPDVFKNLKLEGNEVVGLTGAYQNYVASLKTAIAAKIKQAQIEQLTEKLLKLQGVTLTQTEKDYQNFGNAIGDAYQKQIDGSIAGAQFADKQKKKTQEQTTEIKKLETEISNLSNDLSQLSKGVKLPEIKPPKTKAVKDKSNEIINNAKQLAKELEKIGAIVPDFSALQTKDQQTKIAQAFIKQFENVKIKFKVEVDENAIDIPPITGEQYLTEAEKQAEKDGAILGQSFIDGRNKVLTTGFILTPEALRLRNLEAAAEKIKKLGEELADAFSQAFSAALQSGFESIGEGIGNVLSGKDFGKGILQVFSGFLQAIGQALIKFGIVKEGLDKILGPGGIAIPGAAAIGLGILAIASAQLVKNFGGAREKGGPVSGNKSYLVGERGPELFVPSVSGSIVPNNRLSSFSGRPAFATSGGGRTIVRGNDILLASARTQRSQNRVNA